MNYFKSNYYSNEVCAEVGTCKFISHYSVNELHCCKICAAFLDGRSKRSVCHRVRNCFNADKLKENIIGTKTWMYMYDSKTDVLLSQ